MEINITWNICRVCLLEEQNNPQVAGIGQQMRHLFNDDKQLANQIYDCSGIRIKPNDSLPKKICSKCFIMVKQAVSFRETCRASDTYLQSILQRTKSTSMLFNPGKQLLENFIDETITDDPIFYDETETKHSTIKNDLEHSEIQKHKVLHSMKNSKKIRRKQNDRLEMNRYTNDLVNHENEDVSENNINNAVEIDKIFEQPEDMKTQMFISKFEKNIHSKGSTKGSTNAVLKRKSSQLQESKINDGYANLAFDEAGAANDTEETNIHDLKEDGEELYYLLKEIKNENKHLDLEGHDGNENNEHYNIDLIPVKEEDDSIMMHDEEDDENQPQVTLTIITKEEADITDQNSNISNEAIELNSYCVKNEFLVDDYSSNISSRNSCMDKKHNPVILPKRGCKLNKGKFRTAKNNTSSTGSSRGHHICNICGNHFTNRQIMNIHMKVHRQEKNHDCELCSKRFVTACNLQAHMRIHTGEKPYKCQYCERRFRDRTSNLRHERIHTNEKPFQCDDCGKSFSLSATLKKHFKVHSEERSFRCEPCAKSFKLLHQLKAHKTSTLHKAAVKSG